MSSDNYVGNRLNAAGVKASLDNSVKRIIALKPILARILQGCVKEFADLPIDEIENKYIEGTPTVASEPVHEDEIVPVITGSNTEHKTVHEGTVTFDLKFNALVPKGDGYMQLIVNVEAQNRTSYPVLKRGVYYCGRMLSAQYGTVFTKSHYEKLHKVISIWVCFHGSKKKQNTINRYCLKEERLYGKYYAKKDDYALAEVIALYIGDDRKTNNKLLKMLDKIFSNSYNVDEKKKYLQDECGIIMTETVNAEVESMCNYSDYVENQGVAKGEAIGIVKGEAIGEARGMTKGNKNRLLQDIRNLMDSLDLSADKAMQALKLTSEEQQELLPLL